MLYHQVLLIGAVGLLLAAGLRVGDRMASGPAERLVAAAVLAAAIAVVEALGLGLVGLGTEPWALLLASLAVWLFAIRLVAVRRSFLAEVAQGWQRLSPPAQAGLGAVLGVAVAWTVWLLRYPAFDFDNLAYHIPEVVAWVHNGRPGSLVTVVPGFPYANLPITNEVLLAWASGLSRSFAVITVWPAVMLGLLALAGWTGVRALGVRPLTSLLAVAALCAAPMLTSYQGNGANSDLPALVWLVVTGALCAAAVQRRQTGLLAVAVVAAGLAVGTKTTVAPLTLFVLAVAGVRLRGSLHWPGLTGALGLAVLAGGVWYFRDLIQHGSPLWPYYKTPWGDPLPHLQQPNITFFDRPGASLRRFGEAGYATDTFLGCLVVLVGAGLAPALSRARAVWWGAAATAATVVLWTISPDTGAPYPKFPAADAFHGSLRFLMPSVAAATVTLVLAGRGRSGRSAVAVNLILTTALVLSLVELFRLGFPRVPAVTTPLVGAAAGAGALLGVGVWLRPRIPVPALAGLGAVLLCLGLTAGADGLVQRRARLGGADAGPIRWLDVPGAGSRPVYTAPLALVMLSQNDLRRDVYVLPRRTSCSQLAQRARHSWVVVERIATNALLGPSSTDVCLAGWRPVYQDQAALVYAGSSVAPRTALRWLPRATR